MSADLLLPSAKTPLDMLMFMVYIFDVNMTLSWLLIDNAIEYTSRPRDLKHPFAKLYLSQKKAAIFR